VRVIEVITFDFYREVIARKCTMYSPHVKPRRVSNSIFELLVFGECASLQLQTINVAIKATAEIWILKQRKFSSCT
jgi:hypothetical protein